MIDERLKDWATEAQARAIDAVNEHGTKRAAARALGVHRRSIDKAITGVMKKAAAHGYAPEHGLNSPIPAPFIARGHSTLERISGEHREQVLQWTKTRLDETQWLEAVQEAIAGFCEMVEPITPKDAGPLDFNTDIIPWINVGDAHIGMLAHASETGYDFDLEIAERELHGAFNLLIDELPNCERIVIQDMGDATHYDNTTRVTEKSRHALDCALTYPDMLRVYSRVFRAAIDKALTKARYVDVIINMGNHSRSNDWWMRELIDVAYGHTGRVTALNNASPFIGYRMGKTFVLCHHSDQVKPKQLADIMTADFRTDYGECEHHYVDIGHVHHEMVVKQHPAVRVESFNQLARADKYAHWSGYRNRSSITMVLRSKEFGEIGRRVLGINELQHRLYGKIIPAQRYVHRVA